MIVLLAFELSVQRGRRSANMRAFTYNATPINYQNQPSHQKTLPWCGYGYNAPRYFPAGTYCHLSTCPITDRLPIPHCGRRQWQCLTPFCQLFGGRVWLEIVLDSNTMANLYTWIYFNKKLLGDIDHYNWSMICSSEVFQNSYKMCNVHTVPFDTFHISW